MSTLPWYNMLLLLLPPPPLLLLLYAAASVPICVHVSIMVFDIVAGNCCHCYSVYVTVTACNVAYEPLPFQKGECHSTKRWQEFN